MNIQPVTTQNTFKGYDARRFKGFLMCTNSYGIAEEMRQIGEKEGFKIFGVKEDGFFKWKCFEGLPSKKRGNVWAQDLWSIAAGRLLAQIPDFLTLSIKKFFNLDGNFTQNVLRQCQKNAHIEGGNIFLIKGDEKEVLIGENELKDFKISDIEGMYYTPKITVVPQMDFHLDLFMRPLDKKRILLTDDNLTLRVLQNIYSKLSKNPNKYIDAMDKVAAMIKEFKTALRFNTYAGTDDVAKVLKTNRYSVVRVPGRVFTLGEKTSEDGNLLPQHYCNYMNADVLRNQDGQLVYITNKSKIDDMLGLTPEIIQETGCSFEKIFIDCISQYIDKEHIYFVSGKNDFISNLLYNYQGGIHCLNTEVPYCDKDSKN